jgi:hypothetical protein
MSWRAITEVDLLTRISGPELAALRAAALKLAQADPIAATIAQVTRRVRRAVQSCVWNILDADTTKIPEDLLSEALDLIVWEIMKRPGCTIIDNAGARKDANQAAIDMLARVAACDEKIESPTDGTVAAPSPSVTGKTLIYDRTSQDGI